MANYIDKLEFHNLLTEYRKLTTKLNFDNDHYKYDEVLKNIELGEYTIDVDYDEETIERIKNHKSLYVDYVDLTEDEKNNLIRKISKLYNKIGQRFMLIAKNYANKPRYINYSFDRKDDMIAEGYYDMLRYIDNYDHEGKLEEEYRKNGTIPESFSYFSTYAKNGCGRYLEGMYGDSEFFVRLSYLENMDKKESE